MGKLGNSLKVLGNRIERTVHALAPHWYLGALLLVNGLMLLQPVLERARQHHHGGGLFGNWLDLISSLGLLAFPQVVIAAGLIWMSIGIVLRARVAWVFSLLLLVGAGIISLWGDYRNVTIFGYTLALALVLVYYWKRFDRTSLAASSLFAILSVASLVVYAVFGSLYLGADFSPPIRDIGTAFYFSIVSMSTVGYGDIVPHSQTARFFTASIIVLGITVFATSIGAVIGPLVGGNLKRIVRGGISSVTRKNHYVIVGTSSIAYSVYQGLKKRGCALTMIVAPNVEHNYPENADVVIGDPSDSQTLHRAGIATARVALALRNEDAENAFVILAIKEEAPQVKTVALVNDAKNLQRIKRLQSDMVFSPQLLAGELLARTLNQETIDSDLIASLLFDSHNGVDL